MSWPAMYSGVAPIGTLESYTTSPTLDQGPIGSRLTPRAMSAAITERVGIVRILEHLGVSTDVPRMRRARDGP